MSASRLSFNSAHPDAPPPSDPLYRFWPAPGKRVYAYTPSKGFWYGILGERQESPEFPFITSWEVFALDAQGKPTGPPSYYCVNAMEGFQMLDEDGKPLSPYQALGYPEGVQKPR